jgi:hypothetical protein
MLSQVPSKETAEDHYRLRHVCPPVQIERLSYQCIDLYETAYQTEVTDAQYEVRAFMIISRPVRDEYKKYDREDKHLVV